jgi:hypothetical protein
MFVDLAQFAPRLHGSGIILTCIKPRLGRHRNQQTPGRDAIRGGGWVDAHYSAKSGDTA